MGSESRQSPVDHSRLFPLPLSSIERFHLLDQSDQFVNLAFGRFRFHGHIDPGIAQQAINFAIDRHPLYSTTIRKIDSGHLAWVWNPSSIQPIDWHGQLTDNPDLQPIDVYREPAWRVISKTDGNATEIWFYGHHAISDGAGGIQFAADWMKIYNNLINGNEPLAGLHRLDPEALRTRNQLDMLSRQYLRHIWKQPVGLYGASKFIFRRPSQLIVHDDVASPWDFQRQPRVLGLWLGEATTASLVDLSQEKGVMLNSLIIGHFFLHLDQWRRNSEIDNHRPWIRAILPMSIRGFSDRRITATNRASVVQVDRCARDFRDPESLVRGLDWEIGVIRNWQLNKLFLLAIRGMSVLPGMLHRSASSTKCRGTAIFTNLSEPFGRLGLRLEANCVRVGNLLLHEFDFVGPIRRGTPVNLSVQKHLGRIRLSLHADPRVLDLEQSMRFLELFARRLETIT